jgi:dienelactone hydrolase
MKGILLPLALVALSAQIQAKIVTQNVEYRAGEVVSKGFLAYDDAVEGRRPGVLVVHEWWGLNDFVRDKCRLLAALGYVALAADIYGEGKVTTDPKQAGEWAGAIRRLPGLGRARARAALDELTKHAEVDPQRLAAIGFCFGGTVALDLAYGGAPLKAAVCFHGSLPQLKPDEAPGLKAAILALIGADDAAVKPEDRLKFEESMKNAKANWELVLYGGTVHAFMNPAADKLGMPNIAYNARSAARAWSEMKMLFDEVFKS